MEACHRAQDRHQKPGHAHMSEKVERMKWYTDSNPVARYIWRQSILVMTRPFKHRRLQALTNLLIEKKMEIVIHVKISS